MGYLSGMEAFIAVIVGVFVSRMIMSKNKWISVVGIILTFAFVIGASYFIGYQMGHLDHVCMPDSPKTFL